MSVPPNQASPGEALRPLPWQATLWERLVTARRTDRLPHALLLQGEPGLGKRRFAELLARSMLCEQGAAGSGEPCGACRACRLFAAGTHPDFTVLEPEEPGKPIRVDAVRGLTRKEALTSHGQGEKILLIDPADAMNAAAANALLKTLEEPAGRTLMVLLTAHPARLPATILSRCQRLGFSAPPRDQAVDWLSQQGVDADPGLLYGLSAGSPLKALELAEPEILERRKRQLEELIELMDGRRAPVAVAHRWAEADTERTLEWLTGWAIDLLRLRACARPPLLFNPDYAGSLARLAAALSPERLHRIASQTLQAFGAAGGPLNALLLLEGLLLEWFEAGRQSRQAAGEGARRSGRMDGRS